jgi:chemotaxis protein MotB
MVRKKKIPEQVNHERWLVSYADFITLLFAFFTTMYAISTVDAQKMGKMVMSMRSSFEGGIFTPSSRRVPLNMPGEGSEGPAVSPRVLERMRISQAGEGLSGEDLLGKQNASLRMRKTYGQKDLLALKKEVEALVGAEALQGRVRTRLEGRGLIISLGEGGFFDSGSEIIKTDGRELLNAIAMSLAKADNHVRVEGHTDNVPIKSLKFPSNWELSTARATSVIAYLITKFGLPPEQLSAAGYAEYHPVATNRTEEGRAKNRRIDIVVLDPMYARLEPH